MGHFNVFQLRSLICLSLQKAGANTKGATLVRPQLLWRRESHIQRWPDLLPNEQQLIHRIVFRNAEDSIHIKEKMFQGFYTLFIFKCTELCLAPCHCPQWFFSSDVSLWLHKELQMRSWVGEPGDCPRNRGCRPAVVWSQALGKETFLCRALLSGSWQLRSGVRASPHCSSLPFPSNSEEKGQLEGTHTQHHESGTGILLGSPALALASDRLTIRVRSVTLGRSQSFSEPLLPLLNQKQGQPRSDKMANHWPTIQASPVMACGSGALVFTVKSWLPMLFQSVLRQTLEVAQHEISQFRNKNIEQNPKN